MRMEKEKAPDAQGNLPFGQLGTEHTPGFEYVEPGSWRGAAPDKKFEIKELFEGDGQHVKPAVIAKLSTLEGEARRKYLDQITVDGAIAVEKHLMVCSRCKHIKDHPEIASDPGDLFDR